jgi:hypothetical protein
VSIKLAEITRLPYFAGVDSGKSIMGKVKEQSTVYTSRKARSVRTHPETVPWPPLTASQMRKLSARKRSQLLALQAEHAARMFAVGKEEIIDSTSGDIEY